MKLNVIGNKKPAILADSVEAVIAAIYKDSGLEEAKTFIIENLKEYIDISSKHVGEKDYKTVLQEKLQKKGSVKIEYELLQEKGPDHNKIFVVQVKCNGTSLAVGEGKTKKAADMDAAQNALKDLIN